MRTLNDWIRVLTGCGVKPETVAIWAPVFADTITDDTFSAGDADLGARFEATRRAETIPVSGFVAMARELSELRGSR